MRGGLRRAQDGLALAELLVAGLLASIAAVALLQFFSVQMAALRIETARTTAQVTARAALDMMVRHLEHIGRDPQHTLFTNLDNATLPPAIVTASASSIHYRTNLSSNATDGDTADAWEDVTFSQASGTIWVTQGTGTPAPLTSQNKLRSHVPEGGLAFAYFDVDGDPVTNLTTAAARARVRRVAVSVTVVGGPDAVDGPHTPHVTVSQDVFLRNLS